MLTRSLAALVAISSILESSSTLVAIPLVAKLVPRFETFFAGVPEPQPCRDQTELQKVFLHSLFPIRQPLRIMTNSLFIAIQVEYSASQPGETMHKTPRSYCIQEPATKFILH